MLIQDVIEQAHSKFKFLSTVCNITDWPLRPGLVFAVYFLPALGPAEWIWVHLSFSELPLTFTLSSNEQEWSSCSVSSSMTRSMTGSSSCNLWMQTPDIHPGKRWISGSFLKLDKASYWKAERNNGRPGVSGLVTGVGLMHSKADLGEVQPTLSLPFPVWSSLVRTPYGSRTLWSSSKPWTSSFQTSPTWEFELALACLWLGSTYSL